MFFAQCHPGWAFGPVSKKSSPTGHGEQIGFLLDAVVCKV